MKKVILSLAFVGFAAFAFAGNNEGKKEGEKATCTSKEAKACCKKAEAKHCEKKAEDKKADAKTTTATEKKS